MRTLLIGGLCCTLGLLLLAAPVFAPVAKEEARYAQTKTEAPVSWCDSADLVFAICIPKIHIRGSVLENDTLNLSQIAPSLRKGIVHLSASADPGEWGNGVYFGHSDDVPWDNGPYKTIFALLGKLEKGDEVYLFHNEKRFRYQVISSQVISARDVSVLDNQKEAQTITLITCWPPGTTLKRLAVRAAYQP